MEKKEIVVAHIIGKWLGGGVESVVMNYYRHIDRTKIQFDFICDEDSTNIPYEEIEKLGGRVILIPPYQKLFKYHNKLKKILKDGNYKIVHSHINTLSIFSLFAAKCAGVPVRIAHSHSTTNKKEKKKNLLKQVLRPFSKVFATDYMCCSELAGRWLFGNKEYDKGNVYLLNNAIDLDKFKYDEKIRSEKRKKLNISDDTLVIGHVGRFVEQKNHRFLIDIFNEIHKQNSNSILLLAGQGPLMEEIKSKVESLGLEKFVIFLGQRNDIDELYQAFDVFCLPSLYEGLPVVGVEAQATGLLCIFSDDMTKETKVLDTTEFLSLKQSAEEWADTIIEKNKIFKRISTDNEISNNGFCIEIEKNKIENYYFNKIKIKVCHVISGLNSGGVESIIYNYCSRMDAQKYEWHILYQHNPSEKSIQEFKSINFKLKRIPAKVRHPLKNYFETKTYLKQNKIDIVHCHMTMMNFIPLIAAKRIGIRKRICHSHNSDNRRKNILIRFLEIILKKINILYSTDCVACGEEAGKYMYGNKKFKIIKNALDLNKYIYLDSNRKKIRKVYEIENDKFVVGHIGRFSNQKNHEFIVNIADELINKRNFKNIKFIMVGDGENRIQIENQVKLLKLEDYFIFTGIVNNTNEYYSAFDCFILPSLWEGLPVVGLEAQVAGLKCLFSTKIDEKVKIVKENVKFLHIDNVKIWGKEIQKINPYNRKINLKIFSDNGLDILSEVSEVEKNIYGRKE